jgi:hypothetical protein
MKQITRFAILTTLLVGSAYAASQRYGALYTFECNGSQFQRSGPCPDGGRPDSLIRGSDGNFYGVAQGVDGRRFSTQRRDGVLAYA